MRSWNHILLLLLSGLIGVSLACDRPVTPEAATAAIATAPPVAASVTRVEDLSLICMVTDRYFGQPQIPTEFESRTYYGCCEMCAAKLRTQAGVRNATDPVTGRGVDKAKAAAGKLVDGRVLYFESPETLARYRP